jgi:glutathione synthase/RimK-type ligase-like ATP-grasp enzyme
MKMSLGGLKGMPDTITEYKALREAMQTAEKKLHIKCTHFSDPRLVKLQKDNKTRFIFGYLFDINPEAAAEVVNDKSAMYEVMLDAGIAAVPHYILSNGVKPTVELSDLAKLFERQESLVIKPNGGNKGDMIAKFNNAEDAFAYIKANPKVWWCAAPYVDILREIRLIVLNGAVRLACEKVQPKTINGLKMYNLTLGATAKMLSASDIDRTVVDLAVHAMAVVGLSMGAVDIVFTSDGNPLLLEINDGFSMERFALSSNKARQGVVRFYEQAIEEMFR